MDQSYFNVFDHFTDAVVICRDGALLYANESARTLVGASLLERDSSALFGALSDGSGPRSGSIRLNGRTLTVNAVPMGDCQMYRIVVDSTDDDIKHLADSFSANLRSASSQQIFASDIIRPYISRIDDRQFLDSVAIHEHSSYRIARDADNIAFLGSMGEWQGFGSNEQFNAVTAVTDLIESLPAFLRSERVRLDYSGISDAYISGESSDLERILLNLISNAFKYSPADKPITIVMKKRDSRLQITVRDEGCGIPEDRMAYLFDAWRQPRPTNDPKAGLGLGLHVSRQLAERLRGTLMIESLPGRGTSATVVLPVQDSNHLLLRDKRKKYGVNSSRILTDLADILPTECYRSRFLD